MTLGVHVDGHVRRVLAALGLLGLAVASLGTRPALVGEGWRVLRDAHQVEFQRQVRFELEVEGPAEIASVVLRYRAGSREITSIAYPEFQPGRRIAASFDLETGGSRYLPPFTVMRYSYLLEDAQGGRFETEPQNFRYEDTRFRWQATSRGVVTLYTYDLQADRVERALEAARDAHERMGDLLGVRLESQATLVAYNSRPDFEGALASGSEADRRGVAGLAHDEYSLVVMLGAGPGVVGHEFTHLLVHLAADSAWGRIPAWLNEGLAEYAGGNASGLTRALEPAIREDRLPRLRSMEAIPGAVGQRGLFYTQAHSAVRYLVETYGGEGLRAFLAAFKEGLGLEAALRRAYGRGLAELEADWRRSVGARALTPEEMEERRLPAPEPLPTLVPLGAPPLPAEGPPAQRTPPPAGPGSGTATPDPWAAVAAAGLAVAAVLVVMAVGAYRRARQ